MPIGLSSDEMLDVVANAAIARIQRLEGQYAAVQVGENPRMEELLQSIRKQFPGMEPWAVAALMELLKSLLDAIVANNQALAKVVPHVESSRG